jgi:aryl-alcohol dehydrogenase-like predicted oxidoreductase
MAEGASTRLLPKRHYRDDIQLSLIGLGGMTILGTQQSEVNRFVAEAFERGVNYCDVAPRYGNGEAELKLGVTLRSHRKKTFLACKTEKRSAAEAQIELDRSLKRLQTDHFDLYQFHAVQSAQEVDQILGTGGAAEVFLRARKEGKVRYLGVSAHSVEAAFSLMDRFRLDSILFPVNYVCYAQGNFGPQVLRRAREMGVARMALKAFAYSKTWAGHPDAFYRPIEDPALARQSLRFTLGEDVTAALPPGAMEAPADLNAHLYRLALDFAAAYEPLTAREREDLLASSAGVEFLFKA